MPRLLVTGGAGFIGSNFVHFWLPRHPLDRVVVLDALTYAGNPANLAELRMDPRLRFVHGDIRDTALVEGLLVSEQLDTVVHFAAESHVDRSITGPDAFIDANVIGTHSLLKAARSAWLDRNKVPRHRFHHVSTDEVYGSLAPDEPAFTEQTAYAPNSPYSATKAASDHLVRAYHHTYGLDVTISNCSNNYGPRHFPEKLIPLIIVRVLQGRPLPVYGDGMNVRDWLHVSDHCIGIERILQDGQAGEVYNIGGGAEVPNIDLVRRVCRLIDAAQARGQVSAALFPDTPAVHGRLSESLLTFVKDRPGHDRRYAIDCRKIQSRLGYRAAVKLDDGLASTIDWYLANESWWRAVLDGSYRSATDA